MSPERAAEIARLRERWPSLTEAQLYDLSFDNVPGSIWVWMWAPGAVIGSVLAILDMIFGWGL